MNFYLKPITSIYPKLISWLCIIQTLLFTPIFLQAQQDYRPLGQYTAKVWTPDAGLPNTGTLDVLQTNDGFIWVATYGGVVRFDGVTFENYEDIFPEHKLIYSVLCQGKNNKLWLGSGNGLFFFENGKFTKVKGENNFSPYVEALMSDENGRLWIGTRNDGLYYYESGKFTKVKGLESLEKAFISDIVEGKNKELWLSSPQLGIFRIRGNDIQHFGIDEGLPSDYVNGLYYDLKLDKLWIATAAGLFVFEKNKFVSLKDLEGVDCIHINQHQGFLYVSANLGLLVLDNQGNIIDQFSAEESPQLVASRFDKEGNIWLAGYRSGLTKLTPKKFYEYSQFNQLDGNPINTILEIGKDSILLGNDLGIVFSVVNDVITEHPITQVTKNQRIRDLYKDELGNIWVSTYSGLYKFKGGSVTNHELFDNTNKLNNNSIRFTQEDTQGNYWIGSRTGLFKIDKEKNVKVYTKSDKLTSDFILRVFENPQTNRLWIGTAGGGINILNPDGSIENLLEQQGKDYNVIFNFYQSRDGSIWIAHNGGVSRYYQGKFQTVKDLFALENSTVFEIEEDNLDYFWLNTGEGIIRVQKDTLKNYLETGRKNIPHEIFSKSDGILISSATPNANTLKDSEGNLWFPMVYGVLKINPHRIPKNTLIPPVYVTSIKIDGKKQYAPFIELVIPKDAKRLQIDYTALSYQATEKVKFKCKLEGYDDDWVDMGNKRFIEYTNLSPGNYTFRVIASNNDGVWNEEGASLEIRVEAAFYETKFFYITLFVLIAGFFYFLYRYRTYQVRKRNQELEKQVRLRTEEINEKVQALEQRNEEIVLANERINEINTSLEDALAVSKKRGDDITASINYAQNIQKAILPNKENIIDALSEHFIFFKPRDIVSGDFYWFSDMRKINKRIVLAAVDCTGHGVPGAFMSMVANDLLNYIVNEKRIVDAGLILTLLHKEIRQVLKQEETQNRDGMDMSLVVIDKLNKKIYFSGAKNPLFYIQDNELYQIKGDKMPIGGEQREAERFFTKHEISLKKETTFYLFSDGYQDQFGGKKGRKFMVKRFRELLFEIHQKPMIEQKSILKETLKNWMGEEKQIDDILVMGVKL